MVDGMFSWALNGAVYPLFRVYVCTVRILGPFGRTPSDCSIAIDPTVRASRMKTTAAPLENLTGASPMYSA